MSDRPPAPALDESRFSYPPPPLPDPSVHPQAATGWTTLGTGASVELASPGRRLGARIIDWTIMTAAALIPFIAVVLLAIGMADGDFTDENADPFTDAETVALVLAFIAAALTAGLIVFAYEAVLVAMKGQTVGKMATRIKVVGDDGLVPGWTKSILRSIIPGVAGFIPLLQLVIYLSFTWDKARQGWHDKAAGTLVVKA